MAGKAKRGERAILELVVMVDGAGGDEQNPLVFISRSPWNLYDLLAEFLDELAGFYRSALA